MHQQKWGCTGIGWGSAIEYMGNGECPKKGDATHNKKPLQRSQIPIVHEE